jgi:hypothetical protein
VKHLATAIDIAAPAARVWAVLMDFAAYPQWNPFIRRLAGTPAPGERLAVTLQPEGGQPMSFAPVVLACEPPRDLRWRGRVLLPGVFDGEHVFRIEPAGGGCRFVHEEFFSGLLVPLLMRGRMWAGTMAGFEAMNRALKARAEAPAEMPSEGPA